MIETSDRARELVWSAEQFCANEFRRIDAIEMANQQRVLEAFWQERVSARHFTPTTGYGYDDIGRDTLDRVFAHALLAQKALVRPQFVNGTHAILPRLRGSSSRGTRSSPSRGNRMIRCLRQSACAEMRIILSNEWA